MASGGAVGGVVVEVGQDVCAAPPQSAAELGEFLQGLRHTGAQRVDDVGHHGFTAAAVGVGIRGDHALVEAPTQFDGEMVLVGEYGFQLCFSSCAEQ